MHHYTKSSHHFLLTHFKCDIWKLLKCGKGTRGRKYEGWGWGVIFLKEKAKMKLFPTFPCTRALRGRLSMENKFLYKCRAERALSCQSKNRNEIQITSPKAVDRRAHMHTHMFLFPLSHSYLIRLVLEPPAYLTISHLH